jgi:methylglyoxal synthase
MNIALIAHDAKKKDMVEWALHNKNFLANHRISATGTTGNMLEKALERTDITKYLSGPYGGDLEIGAKICNKEIDLLVFFWDPLSAQPHDVDVKALLRVSMIYNIPVACNRKTADLIITSTLI